jgi:hypothetical protein
MQHRSKGNRLGSKTNLILCEYECTFTIFAMTAAEDKLGMRVCTVMHDGFMVYGDHYADEERVCAVLTEALKREYGINMPFTMKPHDDTFKLPESVEITPKPKAKKVTQVKVVNFGLYKWTKSDAGIAAWMKVKGHREAVWSGVATSIREFPTRLTKQSDFGVLRNVGPTVSKIFLDNAPDEAFEEYDGPIEASGPRIDTINRILMQQVRRVEPITAKRLRKKFTRLGLSEEEQQAELKAIFRECNKQCTIAFDTETCPFGVHKSYCCSATQGNTTKVFRGQTHIKDMLDWCIERANEFYGPREFARAEAPCVNMVAHNLGFDISQVIQYLYKVTTIEQKTNLWGMDA